MRKLLLAFGALFGFIGAILSLIMFISAIRFGEIGRVVLYFVTLLVCGELSVISLVNLFGKKQDKT